MAFVRGAAGELQLDERAEASWRNYLAQFKEEAFPIFERHGFTFPEAFLAWQQNKIHNALDSFLDRIDTDE